MNQIKAILVDDEPRGLTSLVKLLQMNCPQIDVAGCCADAREATEQIQKLQPDLVFLDVAMPGKNGFELLKSLPEINFEIIFVTAYNHFMTQAFHYSAVDYLLKPVEDDLLVQAVDRASRRIEQKSGSKQVETFLHNINLQSSLQKFKLCIHSMKGFQVVEINDIIYCEASSNYTNFYLSNKSMLCASKPIHEYEYMLADNNFVRIHKSYLINIDYIKEYLRGEGGSVIMEGGHEVEVSRRKKDLLMQKMKEHYKY